MFVVISKMKLVNVLMDNGCPNNILSKLVELGYFHPEPANKFMDNVHGLTALGDENPVTDVLARFNEMLQDTDMTLPMEDVKSSVYNPEGTHKYTDSARERFENGVTIRRKLEAVIQESRDTLTQVRNIESVDLNLDDLPECKYIKIHFRGLPIDGIEKLQYHRSRPFIFKSFSADGAYSWCVYFTTARYEGNVDNIFSSPYFERIRIPEFVHGNPVRAKRDLWEEIDNNLKQPQHISEVIEALEAKCTDNLAGIKAEPEFMNHTFKAGKYVLGLGERFSIIGFTAEENVPKLKESLSSLKEVEIEVRPAHSDK